MYGELSTKVQRLRESLTTQEGKLTSLELDRRRNLLESLARKCGTVRDKLTESGPVSGNSRTQLLADLGTSSWGVSPTLETNRTGVRETERLV